MLDSAKSLIHVDAKVCFDFIGTHIFYLDQVKVFAKLKVNKHDIQGIIFFSWLVARGSLPVV